MKKIVFLIVVSIFCIESNCQYIKVGDSLIKTNNSYLDEISYFWKLDSMGINGFRFVTYKCLLSYNKNEITIKSLLNKLGKPNEVINNNLGGKYYLYYYLDGKKLPPEANLAWELFYISFRFDDESECVSFIGTGHLEKTK